MCTSFRTTSRSIKSPLESSGSPESAFPGKTRGSRCCAWLLSTAVGFGFYWAGFSESNIITVYILGVLVTAVWTSGHLYGAVNSLLSVAGVQLLFYRAALYLPGQRPQLSRHVSDYAALQHHRQLSGQPRQGAGPPGGAKELLYGAAAGKQPKAADQCRTEWDCLRLTAEQLSRHV